MNAHHTHPAEDARQPERRRRDIAARWWCWWHSGPGASTGQAGQSTVEYALLEHCLREELNLSAPRHVGFNVGRSHAAGPERPFG